MEAAPAEPEEPQATGGPPFSARSALVLAAWFGLLGGYLDLGMIFLRRDVFHATLYYEQGRDFRWVVPLANLAILLVPGLVVAALNRLRPGLVPARFATWLFATLALWGPLLRAPLYGAATLLLAAGVARWLTRRIDASTRRFRRFAQYALIAVGGLLVATAALAHRRQSLAEHHALARLTPAPAGARNVLLVVMDTVRAESLSLYGAARDTAPELSRWAKKGVKFDWAMAPAPWTFPSHGSFLTGQWPSVLRAHWLPVLDPSFPTLAEFLSARGYATAGFAANTHWCSYESGMDRGFAHYEDYPLTPRNILASTMPGRWLLSSVLSPGEVYVDKWVRAQSRDAAGINAAFLAWLARRPSGRPFFAFLNYLDAHDPFIPPPDGPHFGLRPRSSAESRMLLDYWDRDKLALGPRERELAHDAYDDCVAALDRRVGALLDELERRGVLRDTVVIVTSDHGEHFGEHGVYNHGYSVYTQEVRVPLLIVAPTAPAGRTVPELVSLRDLPATAVDLAGLGTGSPFPGRSLAETWKPEAAPGEPHADRVLSEVDIPMVVPPQRGRGPSQRGFTIALAAEGLHYILDVRGTEELYDLAADPRELHNLKDDPGRASALSRFRAALRQLLADDRAPRGLGGEYRLQLRAVLDALLPKPPA